MVAAIREGYPQREIADAAYRFQREFDAGERRIVGVNAYVDESEVTSVPVLSVPPGSFEAHMDRLARTRRDRDPAAVESALAGLRDTLKLLPELLEAHRRAQLEAQHPGLELGLVFPTAKGTPHKGTPLNVVLREACKSLGFPRLSPHGLRRTYNNLLRQVAEGAVVRSIVGHTTEAMTEHYSVISLNEKRAAAGKVLELVRATKDKEPMP